MYLVGEISLYGDNSDTNQHIIEVLTNLSINFSSEFPFLRENSALTDLLSKISEENYSLDVLKQLANNMINMIGYNSYLLEYIITKNYFEEITLYLLFAMDERLLEEESTSIEKIQTYSLTVLNHMKAHLNEQLESISAQIDYIQGNSNAETLFEAYGYPL